MINQKCKLKGKLFISFIWISTNYILLVITPLPQNIKCHVIIQRVFNQIKWIHFGILNIDIIRCWWAIRKAKCIFKVDPNNQKFK